MNDNIYVYTWSSCFLAIQTLSSKVINTKQNKIRKQQEGHEDIKENIATSLVLLLRKKCINYNLHFEYGVVLN